MSADKLAISAAEKRKLHRLSAQEYRVISRGKTEWTDETPAKLAEALVVNHGFLHKACVDLGLSYDMVQKRIERSEELQQMVAGVRQYIRDEIEYRYLDRVLDPEERNPAWLIFWLKKNHPTYYEGKSAGPSVVINITDDSTRKVDVIEGSVVRASLAETNEHRSEVGPTLESSADSDGSP